MGMKVGHVRTARGKVLNMGEMKAAAKKKPLREDIDLKNKVMLPRAPRAPLNIIGHLPSSEGVAPPTASVVSEVYVEPVETVHETPAMADITGIVVDHRKLEKRRGVKFVGNSDALSEITAELANMDAKRAGKK